MHLSGKLVINGISVPQEILILKFGFILIKVLHFYEKLFHFDIVTMFYFEFSIAKFTLKN